MPEQPAFITIEDLRPYLPGRPDTDLQDYIDDALGIAIQIAPCIERPSFAHRAALKGILRSAIRYNASAGNGSVTQTSSGPFQKTTDTRQAQSGILFSPAQVERLEAMCKSTVPTQGAYSVPFGRPESLYG
ncbi:hypothetical protein R4P64_07740 [Rhodococcus sp. IEGM 1366]|uniref:hypothetical protein n=1 Tax=Rhodococcus sp. IEGM 1366 TaxID=3082223 RepID=UPI002952CA1E|nr:hypothetical protein [Rhodococcus sp. IEGM 1366]MDV8066393.1 hypothetical protein [Rhodococcus sp. IEGM 1366]